MGKEELLKTLRDAGLKDEDIRKLLAEAIEELDAASKGEHDKEVEEGKALAGNLLGVDL